MTWQDIVFGLCFILLVVKYFLYRINSHPSDKYHNDSWRSDRRESDRNKKSDQN